MTHPAPSVGPMEHPSQEGIYWTECGTISRSKVQWLSAYEKFLEVQKPFFKKVFGRRRCNYERSYIIDDTWSNRI